MALGQACVPPCLAAADHCSSNTGVGCALDSDHPCTRSTLDFGKADCDDLLSQYSGTTWIDDSDDLFSASSSGNVRSENTLTFLDWDDTLFPNSWLFEEIGLAKDGVDVPEELSEVLEAWQLALRDFLVTVIAHSGRCVILTNSRQPWISNCVDRFAPSLRPLILEDGAVRIVYAQDALHREWGETIRQASSGSCGCLGGLLFQLQSWYTNLPDDHSPNTTARLERDRLTRAKAAGALQEVESFYYDSCAWHNVLSFGDQSYEREAIRNIQTRCLRAKTVTFQGEPVILELVNTLRAAERGFVEYVMFDDSFDIELHE